MGYAVHGVDNNMRAEFFRMQGDTRWNQARLQKAYPTYVHHELDIRDRSGVAALVKTISPDVIVHTAAQPSHDRAAEIPFDDFDVNAVGTLNLLEAARRACPESPFLHMSTNKVYGDAPNQISLAELETRWDYADPVYADGIPETFTIDQSKHSLFGASKVAADVMVQEYGRYFGMRTCCLRGGCLTGAAPLGRGAAWLFELFGQMQSGGPPLHCLWLQRRNRSAITFILTMSRDLSGNSHRRHGAAKSIISAVVRRTASPCWKCLFASKRFQGRPWITSIATDTARVTTSAIIAICAK